MTRTKAPFLYAAFPSTRFEIGDYFHYCLAPYAQGKSFISYPPWFFFCDTPCDSSNVASKLLPLMKQWHLKPQNPFWLIFRLFHQQFLNRSIEYGLAAPALLSLTGGDSLVRTTAQQRKKLCNYLERATALATVNSITHSHTATGDGIPTGNVTSLIIISHVCGLRFPQ